MPRTARGPDGPRKRQLPQALRRLADPWKLAGFAGLFVVWWLAHLAVGQYLPGPGEILSDALRNLFSSRYMEGMGLPPGGYLPHLIATSQMTLGGVLLGGLLGVAMGLIASKSRMVEDMVAPVAAILGTIPILIATPFFIIWFGLATSAKVALVAFYSAVMVYLYTLRALANVPPAYREYATTLGAGEWRSYLGVLFPASLPEIFGGLRLALMNAWGLATIVELMGASVGIGRLLSASWAVYDTTAMMSAILWISIIAVACDALLLSIRRYLLRWTETSFSEV